MIVVSLRPMWPGEQQPGGGANPHPHNPYRQPGYQQPNPYAGQQPPAHRTAPIVGPPPPVPGGGGSGRRSKVVAIVAAGVTGFLVLGGGKDHRADPDPTASSA